MSKYHNIVLRQGDADTLTEVIENLTALTGYTAKLYIVEADGTSVDTITGNISGLNITYEIVNESSKAYPVGVHDFETKIYDSSDHVYTPSYGKFIVEPAKENDPS